MRVLVCGSRSWGERYIIEAILSGLRAEYGYITVIEGGAAGADAVAHGWAVEHDQGHERFPALWDQHGKAAGPIRNQQMLEEGKPDLVLAFHDGDSRGTADMIRRATKQKGLRVYVVTRR